MRSVLKKIFKKKLRITSVRVSKGQRATIVNRGHSLKVNDKIYGPDDVLPEGVHVTWM